MTNLSFVCPRCKGELEALAAAYACPACDVTYPILAGIADFRVYPDPYIDLEADRAKGLRLENDAREMNLDFAGLVRHYYAITPEVSAAQARHFTAHHLAGVERGKTLIERLRAYDMGDLVAADKRVIDLGCGTGGFLASLKKHLTTEDTEITEDSNFFSVSSVFSVVQSFVGIDIAFRWLIIGRARLRELGIDAPLVCACADYLPFRNNTFDLATAENLLEHSGNFAAIIREADRVLDHNGGLLGRSVNRYAPAPEPHVGIFALGYLPRAMQGRVVERVKGVPYRVVLPSAGDLRQAVDDSELRGRVTYPKLLDSDLARFSPTMRRLFKGYRALVEKMPILRPLLTWIAPYLDVVARKTAPSRNH